MNSFIVITLLILYNFEVGTIYCLIDAPTKDAVKTHHDKIGVKCDWIMEVETTQQMRHIRYFKVDLCIVKVGV